MSSPSGTRNKLDTRAAALARRDAMSEADRSVASAAISLAALRDLQAHGVRTVAVYAAKATEVDLGTFDVGARALGWTVVYPRVVGDARVLTFHAAELADLVPARLGLREPSPDAPEIALDAVDAFLVPGAAFDRGGHRLGWGRGHYDATLALAPHARRLGVAFACQLVPTLPSEPHDVAMHAVLTEAP